MICNLCNIDKESTEFYKNRKQCKKCVYKKRKCEHGKIKCYCKVCNGSQICEHNHRRNECKECDGSSICEHWKRKDRCKECDGVGICEHKRRRSTCKECNGSQICEHQCIKIICKECNGSQICEHQRRRSTCKECDGGSICIHGERKSRCKDCYGSEICVHNNNKYICKECGGSQICEHRHEKRYCIICSPHIACNHCKLNTMSQIKIYQPYCFNCYCILNSDFEHPRKYKTKENLLTDALNDMNLETHFIQDKIINGGCSKRRPDFLFELFTHTVIIENDENGHSRYDTSCEIAKLNETFTDLGDRPLVLIRFNPDKYKGKSCFDKDGKLIKSEWDKRIKILKETLTSSLKEVPRELIITIKLFFDD